MKVKTAKTVLGTAHADIPRYLVHAELGGMGTAVCTMGLDTCGIRAAGPGIYT